MFDNNFFKEHQKTIIALLNSPVSSLIRKSLHISDLENKIVRITPNSYHYQKSINEYKAVMWSQNQIARNLHINYRKIWESIHNWDMKFANRFFPSLNLGFDSYSSQPDETNGIDTWIANDGSTHGTDTSVYVGEMTGTTNDFRRTLIKFDLSSISAISISAATLSLWVSVDLASNNSTFSVYRLLRNWIEAEASWSNYSSGNAWGTAGAANTTTDFDSTVLASAAVSATESVGTQIDFNFTDPTGLAELLKMTNGTYNNYGWLVRGVVPTETTNCGYGFCSSSNATTANRPRLEVTYTALAGGTWIVCL